jgi:sugar lactone lactonase YvrE
VIQADPANGKLLNRIPIPALKVTSVAFGGPHLDELYVTSANIHLTEEQKKKYPESGATFRVTGLGVKGYPGQPVKL